jgi:CubicO group peptidase (beta-lactamase class C family)
LASVIDDSTRRALDARLAREQAEHRLPSVAAGVLRDRQLVWTGGRGRTGSGSEGWPPDAATQYRAGSITKTFVAVAVLRLRDAGKLRLSDPVAAHLAADAAGSAGGTTIGQLLSHTSGLRAETAAPWWERTAGSTLAELAATSLGPEATRFRPGRRHHYSNVGYGLLGAVLEAHHDRPWHEVIGSELFKPLGMNRTTTRPAAPHATGYAVHPHADLLLPEPEHDAGAMAPAGQLWTTVGDLAAWARFLAGDDGDLLAPDTLAEMREPIAVSDVAGQPWTAGYGLGLALWNIDGTKYYGHTGSMPGFLAVMQITDAPGADTAIAMCNSTTGFDRSLSTQLLSILAESEPYSLPEWTPAEVSADELALLGRWYWGPAPFTLRLAGATLTLTRDDGNESVSRFRRDGDGRWRGVDGYQAGEPLVPVRAADGEVRAIDMGSLLFTRTPYDPAALVPGGVDPEGWRAR